MADAADEACAPVESSDSVGNGIGTTPPVPRMPVEDSVLFTVVALSVSDPRIPDATEPSKPPALVVDSGVVVALAEATGELGNSLVLLLESPLRAGVDDKERGAEAFSALEVASLKDAEEVVEAVPSMIVERPTVIAPRDGDSATVELLAEEDGPVGAGSAKGCAKPVEPTCDEPSVGAVPTGRSAERVERIAVELADGDSRLSRTPPPVPTRGPVVLVLTS